MFVLSCLLAAEERAEWIFFMLYLIYGCRFSENKLLQSRLTFLTYFPLSVIFTHRTHTLKLMRKQLNGVAEGFISRPDDVRLHEAIWRLKSNSHSTLI